ncbi:hypothetical protein Tco_0410384 [Tanacetum coccineum]
MGLPCAHKKKHMKGNVLSLDLVHSHWRIDTLSLIQEDDSHDDDANKFVPLLDELRSNIIDEEKLEVLRSFMDDLYKFNQLSHVSSPLLSKPTGSTSFIIP